MSITFPAAYTAQIKNSVVDVDWLFHLKNNNAGFVYLSSKDRTVGTTRYYGVVEDSGEISKDIDLINCKASIGEISISCADVYQNGKLSAELLHNGADVYINQQVLIYECLNNEATLANCPKLYEGRLKEIDIQGNSIVLVIEQLTPFDHIEVPQTVDTVNHVFQPFVYGQFTGNSADADSFCPGRNLYPAPYFASAGDKVYYAPCRQTDCVPHYYDKRLKIFIPINNVTTEQTKNGLNAFYFTDELSLTYSVRATGATDVAGGHWANPTYVYDADSTTHAGHDIVVLFSDTHEHDLSADNFYDNNRLITDLKLRTKAQVEIKAVSTIPPWNGNVYLRFETDAFGPTTFLTRSSGDGVGITATGGAGSSTTEYGVSTGYNDYDITGNANPVISGVSGVLYHPNVSASAGTVTWESRIYDVYLKITSEFDKANDPSGAKSGIEAVDQVYVDTDGTPPGYTDAEATAYEAHQIHRDIMYRWAGVNFADAYMLGFAALDTARANWKCRMWELEPKPIKDILEQLQFEGCFIFTLTADSDGSGTSGGRYIWVKDSYDSNDVVQTLGQADYTDLSVGHTDVFEIITKSVYDFDRSPVDNSYRQEDEYDNTADRDLYNLGTSHEERISLDYLVGSTNGTDAIYDSASGDNTPNESIALYRDNIQSEPKIMVDCEIINKAKTNVEYGDIIKFSDTNVLPYGKAWANLWFMVVREARTKQGVSITAREVYRT